MILPALKAVVTVREEGWQLQCTCRVLGLCQLRPQPRHTVLLAHFQVFHHRNRVLIQALADLTIGGFTLSSNLTSSFLKPSLSFSLEHLLLFQRDLLLFQP